MGWQGLGVEPPTFRSEVQRTNHYTTVLVGGRKTKQNKKQKKEKKNKYKTNKQTD